MKNTELYQAAKSLIESIDEFNCIYDLEWIDIYDINEGDFVSYRAWVESEGGNDCTYLSFNDVNLI